MSEQSVFHQMEHWGYYLLPRSHQCSPGYTGLLVAIRETPTGIHFDPEVMRLWLQYENGTASRATLRLRSPFQGPRRVCPGRVVLRDRMDKRVEFFIFGGSLEATSIPGETVYILRSPTPVIELDESLESIPNQLAFETEVILGEMEARWGLDKEGFIQRLSQVDPLQFYLGNLHSILTRCERSQALQETYHNLYHALLEEKRWLVKAGLRTATPVTLEGLLAPD